MEFAIMNLILDIEAKIDQGNALVDDYWQLGLLYLLSGDIEASQSVWMIPLLSEDIKKTQALLKSLVEYLELQIFSRIQKRELHQATVVYHAISELDPDWKNHDILKSLVEKLYAAASSLIKEKINDEAIQVYQKILELDDSHCDSWHDLACLYLEQNNLEVALKYIKKSVNLNPQSYSYLFTYGLIQEKLGQTDLAKQTLVRSKELVKQRLKTNHKNSSLYYLLGSIEEKLQNTSKAITAYYDSMQENPMLISPYVSLANLFMTEGKINKAINVLNEYLAENPLINSVPIYQGLSIAYRQMGDANLTNLFTGYAEYYAQKYDTAIHCLEEYFRLCENKADIHFYSTLAMAYLNCNYPHKAISLLEKGIKSYPRSYILKRLNQVILPVICVDEAEVDFFRHRFDSLLNILISESDLSTDEKKYDAIRSLSKITNFHRAYLGDNVKNIQVKYANYIRDIFKASEFQYLDNSSHHKNNQKIKIGYLSLRFDTLGVLCLNWIKYHNPENFEVYLYDLSGKNESLLLDYRQQFYQYSENMRFLPTVPNINHLCEEIKKDSLDIFIIPEIGLDPLIDSLACFRLAPVQCTTWAHPVTSGSQAIDYFLSSELMEPENGDEHYSEQLIRLPNLGFSLPSVTLPELVRCRSDFGLQDEKIIYFCSQSLYKYLPEHDYIFTEIAKMSSDFFFVFLDTYHKEKVANDFKLRLEKVFNQYNLNFDEYCLIHKRMKREDFLQLNLLSDVFLDSLPWSGGLTTKDAIACDLPVVTLPGELMRARHSYGILRMLGVTETIADSEQNYIDIAVRLGIDKAWRDEVKNKINKNKHKIFEDKTCIEGLERFFIEKVNC